MFRYRIHLDTGKEVQDFVTICSKCPGKIILQGEDEFGVGCTVSARSLIGTLYAMQWHSVYCVAEHEIYHEIKDFIL